MDTGRIDENATSPHPWIPAFAGMAKWRATRYFRRPRAGGDPYTLT